MTSILKTLLSFVPGNNSKESVFYVKKKKYKKSALKSTNKSSAYKQQLSRKRKKDGVVSNKDKSDLKTFFDRFFIMTNPKENSYIKNHRIYKKVKKADKILNPIDLTIFKPSIKDDFLFLNNKSVVVLYKINLLILAEYAVSEFLKGKDVARNFYYIIQNNRNENMLVDVKKQFKFLSLDLPKALSKSFTKLELIKFFKTGEGKDFIKKASTQIRLKLLKRNSSSS